VKDWIFLFFIQVQEKNGAIFTVLVFLQSREGSRKGGVWRDWILDQTDAAMYVMRTLKCFWPWMHVNLL